MHVRQWYQLYRRGALPLLPPRCSVIGTQFPLRGLCPFTKLYSTGTVLWERGQRAFMEIPSDSLRTGRRRRHPAFVIPSVSYVSIT